MNRINSIITYIGQKKIYLVGFIFLFSGLLAIYAVKGSYSRYSQDDYCYGYRVRAEGFWDMQIQSYFHRAEFNSDRYSLTIAHSLAELLGGPKFVPILPSLEMFAWAASLVYVFFQLHALKFSGKNLLITGTAALVILFFTLYLAPNLYQILFWLSGMQTYLTPMVLGTFLFGRYIAIIRSPKFKIRHAIELGILCLFVGGFSETTALWQFVCWVMLLGWAILFRRRSALAKSAFGPALVTVLSAALALVILAICPGIFKSASYTPPNLKSLIIQPFIYGAQLIWGTLKATPVPYLVIAAFGFFLSLMILGHDRRRLRDYFAEILAMLLVLYILSVAVMFPSMLVTAHYPGDRALFPANFTLVLCVFLIGWESAQLILAFKPTIYSFRLSQVLLIILGLALFGYVARTAPRVYDKLPAYQARAAAWDVRQGMILKAKAEGELNITVPAFDSVYGITELHYEPNNWVNICAAKYYGVSTISTADRYDGIPTYPIGK
ncbi:MAG: DUF6056 family protein [Anaerolineales bacterium]